MPPSSKFLVAQIFCVALLVILAAGGGCIHSWFGGRMARVHQVLARTSQTLLLLVAFTGPAPLVLLTAHNGDSLGVGGLPPRWHARWRLAPFRVGAASWRIQPRQGVCGEGDFHELAGSP
ncbi:hypothetical protein AMK16_27260 [Streptomyces sp. CB00455]|nr:hypothetical protein AMK16_27260 [Streptomyces sp. CB00455]